MGFYVIGPVRSVCPTTAEEFPAPAYIAPLPPDPTLYKRAANAKKNTHTRTYIEKVYIYIYMYNNNLAYGFLGTYQRLEG